MKKDVRRAEKRQRKQLKKSRRGRAIVSALLRPADVVLGSLGIFPGVDALREIKEGAEAILDTASDTDDGKFRAGRGERSR